MYFNKRYFIIFLALLITEILIACFITEQFIRGFVGDVLVILLLFYGFRSFFAKPNPRLVLKFILLFAFAMEFAQFLKFTEHLNITNRILKIMLGTMYDPFDLLAYVLGYTLALGSLRSHNSSEFS